MIWLLFSLPFEVKKHQGLMGLPWRLSGATSVAWTRPKGQTKLLSGEGLRLYFHSSRLSPLRPPIYKLPKSPLCDITHINWKLGEQDMATINMPPSFIFLLVFFLLLHFHLGTSFSFLLFFFPITSKFLSKFIYVNINMSFQRNWCHVLFIK